VSNGRHHWSAPRVAGQRPFKNRREFAFDLRRVRPGVTKVARSAVRQYARPPRDGSSRDVLVNQRPYNAMSPGVNSSQPRLWVGAVPKRFEGRQCGMLRQEWSSTRGGGKSGLRIRALRFGHRRACASHLRLVVRGLKRSEQPEQQRWGYLGACGNRFKDCWRDNNVAIRSLASCLFGSPSGR
jgi:hypothetical protein